MAAYRVLVIPNSSPSVTGRHVIEFFEADSETDIDSIPSRLSSSDYKVIVFDCLADESLNQVALRRLLKMEETFEIPIVVLSGAQSVQDKLDALEVGADDFVEPHVEKEEVCARITRSILHRVAADQLSSRLELANQTAYSAMVDNSDLGANIQFLLRVHECDNLDQLGQLFFTTIERYGLKCSLQIRGDYEIKNMEAHGMAKDLESQLLSQLKDAGRYVDFGPRTIVNFERVSLLVKNMPIDDDEKYGAIKDNTFALIQGVNARVAALEDHTHLIEEWETLTKLASDVRSVMSNIQSSYQKVMRDIAAEVDTASEALAVKLPSFALTEPDERYIEDTMANCVKNTTEIFNIGLKVDEAIQRLEVTIDRSLSSIEQSGVALAVDAQAVKPPENTSGNAKPTADVELF